MSLRLPPIGNLNVYLTNHCIMRCRMCKIWQNSPPSLAISLPRWRELLATFAPLVSSNFPVILSGGEVLTVADLAQYIAAVAENGLRPVICTSGYLLTRKKIEELNAAGLQSYAISVDSLNPAIHNALRGREGALERVLQAIPLIKECNPQCDISLMTTIMRVTLAEIPALLDFTAANPLLSGIYFQCVTQTFNTEASPHWQQHPEHEHLWPGDFRQTACVLGEIIARRIPSKVQNPLEQLIGYVSYFRNPENFRLNGRCKVDQAWISIDCDGSVRNCPFGPPLGNVADTSIEALLSGSAYIASSAAVRTCQRNCHVMLNCFFLPEDLPTLVKP